MESEGESFILATVKSIKRKDENGICSVTLENQLGAPGEMITLTQDSDV